MSPCAAGSRERACGVARRHERLQRDAHLARLLVDVRRQRDRVCDHHLQTDHRSRNVCEKRTARGSGCETAHSTHRQMSLQGTAPILRRWVSRGRTHDLLHVSWPKVSDGAKQRAARATTKHGDDRKWRRTAAMRLREGRGET
eukprot:6171979-Pleurochrysis_carterae.AAC.2